MCIGNSQKRRGKPKEVVRLGDYILFLKGAINYGEVTDREKGVGACGW